ncbi:PHB depolymerase family esterase [Sphingosinicella sp. YJ22]|uniref:extracellular catalytic domain type 1 short-chain-length polyhydroxyalkanoate depolymerase n=1 Tax=Sphingosinicella sp. YJ22 TaxID=1104780 RepID=UPI00140B0125|nr:PHB depolymerase family esterase [Sphingosinicella sp. YJ22]
MSLSDTLSRLSRGRGAFAAAFPATRHEATDDRLSELEARFVNPGNLRARCYLPDRLERPAALLVVLHGCTQNAAGYDQGAGWSALADRHGFALLYPEQKRENNPNLCFNWYQAGDSRRGSGEAASIAAMVEAMRASHGIDPDRIFVTGLSAGGAMAAVMLATYPELFAGGAIIAGMPYGCASNLAQAFDLMAGRGTAEPGALADKVRAGSRHRGAWPRLSVWHGSADRTVVPANADALVAQWTGLHGLGLKPDRTETVDGHRRRVWLGREGQELIEHYDVAGMAHGTPLMPGTGEGESGEAQAHMLDVGLSSTDRIAAFFGIGPEVAARKRKAGKAGLKAPAGAKLSGAAVRLRAPRPKRPAPTPSPVSVIQKTIEDALRSAGLMK